MKKLTLLLALAMATIATAWAQHECNCGYSCICDNCTAQVTPESAMQWAQDHQDRLVAAYLAQAGNKLDPDELRKQLEPIGYDGTNVPLYRKAEWLLVDTVYTLMLHRAVAAGNSSIVVLTGPGGSGKSTSTRTMDFSRAGVLYDSALNSYSSLKQVVEKAQAHGMTQVTVVAIYNDIVTCYKNAVGRGKATGRFLGLDYLVEAFRNNAHKIELLRLEHPEVDIIAVDNTGNNGGRRVTADEAEHWDFSVSAATLNELLTYLLNEINKGELKGHQLASVSGNVQGIEGLDDTGKSLAEEIARRVREGAK